MKFKVGDIITGISKVPYDITTSDAKMKVVALEARGLIEVVVIYHSRMPENVGNKFIVSSEFFKHVPKIGKKKVPKKDNTIKEKDFSITVISQHLITLKGTTIVLSTDELKELRNELDKILL